ncbi:hypothetical protein DDE18_10920 [Nocardioides gansuensis]|uniref:AbiEi antitoxin N-terminal domain-containing protein n=1 Tax=Nocardioides gansuensis TaxID=2138300 RepID=A0A2T8FAX9_9ACTN|nr:type IV toxin-antitoxin system AbiEi family antitoxin domain-containing protein [Nocardioides gansuensis]PVG82860.1 hypothetical protein DDE18_10920 [Nocardioides gansuensis]
MYLPVRAQLASQHGLLTYAQAHRAGLTNSDLRRLLKAKRLVPVRWGVYADAEAWDALDEFRGRPMLRIRATALTLRSSAYVFSHDSAAIPQEMGAPDPRTAHVHVTRPKVHGDAVRAGVKHHRAPFIEAEVVEKDDLRMLGMARTALDMAREHGRAAGLAACDAALRAGVPRAALVECFERMGCWPESRVIRWCIENADDGAQTYLESQTREFVLELGIGTPQTQFGLHADGRTVWCDIRVHRHIFEPDGHLKYLPGNPSGLDPDAVLWEEKKRQDFVSGFKLGVSRITAFDMGAGREAAIRRVGREYADTCRRFGTDISDLALYIVTRQRRPWAS